MADQNPVVIVLDDDSLLGPYMDVVARIMDKKEDQLSEHDHHYQAENIAKDTIDYQAENVLKKGTIDYI